MRPCVQSFDPGELIVRAIITIPDLGEGASTIEGQWNAQVRSQLDGTWTSGCTETDDGYGRMSEWHADGTRFTYREKIFDSCLPLEPLRSTWEHSGVLK